MDAAFDMDMMAKYFAITDILEAFHGAVPKSLKFYFNPVTSKLEPVGFDGHFLDKQYPVLLAELGDWRSADGFWTFGSWFTRFFKGNSPGNIKFLEAYFAHLERLAAPEYMANFLSGIEPELERNLGFIFSDFPIADLSSGHPLSGVSPLFTFSRKTLEDRQAFVRGAMASGSGLFSFVTGTGTVFRRCSGEKFTNLAGRDSAGDRRCPLICAGGKDCSAGPGQVSGAYWQE